MNETMVHVIWYLGEDDGTALRCKELLILHHVDNLLCESLHCCLHNQKKQISRPQTHTKKNSLKKMRWDLRP